jgi:hypothetical protein
LNCPNQHDPASHNHGKQGDDVDHAEDIQDNIAWACKLSALAVERHVEHFDGANET